MTETPSETTEAIEVRLERIEKKLDRSRAGEKGIGCLGFALFVYVIYLLQQVLERLAQ